MARKHLTCRANQRHHSIIAGRAIAIARPSRGDKSSLIDCRIRKASSASGNDFAGAAKARFSSLRASIPKASFRSVSAAAHSTITEIVGNKLAHPCRRHTANNMLYIKDFLVAGGALHSVSNQSVCFQRLTGRLDRVTGIYARWHMFEEKREAIMAIEAAVLPLMPEMAR